MATSTALPDLSLTPHTPSSLPTDLHLFIQAATELLDTFDAPASVAGGSGWKQGKTHDGIDTFTRKKQSAQTVGGNAFWAARRSVHPQGDYDTFKDSLLLNHAIHESKYIPSVARPPETLATFPSTQSPAPQTWLINYSMPFPLQPRHFVILLLGEETVEDQEFVVVTVPFEPTDAAEKKAVQQGGKGVRGRYSAVERIKRRPDGGVEWVMMTCSTPAGWVPQFLTDKSVAGEVAKDVKMFLNWVEKGRPGV